MTVAGGGGAAGAGAVIAAGAAGEGTAAGAEGAGPAAGAAGAGVSVVVDGCCALALTKPLIESANTAPSSDDVFNRFMGFLPGNTLHAGPVAVPVWLKRSESVTTVPFTVKASTAASQCETEAGVALAPLEDGKGPIRVMDQPWTRIRVRLLRCMHATP